MSFYDQTKHGDDTREHDNSMRGQNHVKNKVQKINTEMTLCDTMNQEWQLGYDAWFANAWQDPNDLPFQSQQTEREALLKDKMKTASNCFKEGVRDARQQWINVRRSKVNARSTRVAVPPSICSICCKAHGRVHSDDSQDQTEKMTINTCMDIQFRLEILKSAAKEDKNSSSRCWFASKDTWRKQPLRFLPQDVAKFGKLVRLNDKCGLLFAYFEKYASTFHPHEVAIPALLPPNFKRTNTEQVSNGDRICVVDDRLNAVILCARCGLKFEIDSKPTTFDKRCMHYVDIDDITNDQNQPQSDDDCYPVKNAMLFENQVIHPLCHSTSSQLNHVPNTTKQSTPSPQLQKLQKTATHQQFIQPELKSSTQQKKTNRLLCHGSSTQLPVQPHKLQKTATHQRFLQPERKTSIQHAF